MFSVPNKAEVNDPVSEIALTIMVPKAQMWLLPYRCDLYLQ